MTEQYWAVLDDIAEIGGAALLAAGAFFCMTAAIGLVRLPQVLDRMHAAAKPQSLGLLLVLAGLALSLRQPAVLGVLALVGILQLLSAPVAAHFVARTAYRTNQVRVDLCEREELRTDLSRAGYTLAPSEQSAAAAETESGEPEIEN